MHSPDSLPALHIRPRRGWLNDPNAVTRVDERWHVFFQHNPLRAQHGAIHWGHVSSSDLVSWTEHPVAFGPQPGAPDQGGCWSGSFVPGLDRPAVAYTGIVDGPAESTVCVRYAQDAELVTWSDPVVVARQPQGIGLAAMRDPYPFTWGGRRFAVIGAGMTDGTPAVLLFSCDDPHDWTYEGIWLDGRDKVAASVAPARLWECPQLVRLGGDYVLILSLWLDNELQDVVHLVGRMEPSTVPGLPRFAPVSGGPHDHGPDFFAPQAVEDPGNDPLLFGWIRQEDAPDDAHEDAVAGCLTLPRRLALQDQSVHVRPDAAVDALVGEEIQLPRRSGTDAVPLPSRSRVSVRSRDDHPARVELVAEHRRIPLDVDAGGYDIWLDGEVAEIFQAHGVAGTARSPGSCSWSLLFDPDRCSVKVRQLGSPPAGVR